MIELAPLLVIISIVFLSCSIRPALVICKKESHFGWRILFSLISFFLLAYLFFLVHLWNHNLHNDVEFIVTLILFGGSFFVFMVINLSLKSILQVQKTADEALYNSLHDPLTGLANRKYFLQTLKEQVNQSKPFMLLLLDLKNFKQINDILGHYFADKLLNQVAQIIGDNLQPGYFFSRIGSDQFTLLSSTENTLDADVLVSSITHLLKRPFNVNTYNIQVDICCGGACFPESSNKVESLLQQADMALNAAKAQQCTYMMHNESLDNDAKSTLEISSKLHDALANNEFEVHYQPIMSFSQNDTNHFEALIRWPTKEGGYISPEIFIPIAEQGNLIRKITTLVLNNICQHLREIDPFIPNASIHLNLSVRDLQDDNISKQLASLIDAGKLLPAQLVLEVTETAIMKDIPTIKNTLNILSKQGFMISLDDFGTGYSSLSMLLELPINQIKIDRSFVTPMGTDKINNAIVKSIIFMAHNLDCSVVAEGVETLALVDKLNDLKCDYLQGYYFSKALPVQDLIESYKQQK